MPDNEIRDGRFACVFQDENGDLVGLGRYVYPGHQEVEGMNAQQQVAENTAARGHREGWTAEQFAARQVAKLQEELGELAWNFSLPKYGLDRLEISIDTLGVDAGGIFDNDEAWHQRTLGGVSVDNSKGARLELADIQVVVFNLAQALAEITGEPFDVVQAAVKKSAADVDRGVR